MRSVRRVLLLLSIPLLFLAQTDPRIPDEVGYKSRYINPIPKPPEFASAVLWGIAIADTRVPATNTHESRLHAPNSPAAWTAKT